MKRTGQQSAARRRPRPGGPRSQAVAPGGRYGGKVIKLPKAAACATVAHAVPLCAFASVPFLGCSADHGPIQPLLSVGETNTYILLHF